MKRNIMRGLESVRKKEVMRFCTSVPFLPEGWRMALMGLESKVWRPKTKSKALPPIFIQKMLFLCSMKDITTVIPAPVTMA